MLSHSLWRHLTKWTKLVTQELTSCGSIYMRYPHSQIHTGRVVARGWERGREGGASTQWMPSFRWERLHVPGGLMRVAPHCEHMWYMIEHLHSLSQLGWANGSVVKVLSAQPDDLCKGWMGMVVTCNSSLERQRQGIPQSKPAIQTSPTVKRWVQLWNWLKVEEPLECGSLISHQP